jgi:hypothetical protein
VGQIRRISVRSQPGQIALQDPISKKSLQKNRAVECFKVKALSSSLNTTHTKKSGNNEVKIYQDTGCGNDGRWD